MDFKGRLILLFIIQAVGLFCQNPTWKCTKEVSNCPITKELWYKRYEEFPCFKEGLNYTCMMAVGGVLVEACINNYAVLAFTGSRCPYIHSCDGIEPVLGIEDTWPLCPEDVIGCPPSNHPRYTVTHMYKYPACIVRKVTEVITTVLPEALTSPTSFTVEPNVTTLPNVTPTSFTMEPNVTTNNDSNKQATNSYIPGVAAGVTVTVVIILLSIIVICVIKRKRGDRSKRRGRDEETQLFLPLRNSKRHFHHLKKKLVTLSKTMTEKVTLSPVQIYANIPVELLYAKVVIQTNARYVQLGRQYFQDSNLEMEQKTVEKPDDIFYKNKEQTKRIFMVGNAAHGKTMYCLWLLQHWYHAQSEPKGTETHDEWRKAVGKFDLVFLIQLRAVKKSSATIIDMICKDILKIVDIEYIGWLTKALKSGAYRCLILIDGLDEWKPDQNVTEDVRFNGMPITDDIENCVIFFTMRPWKFEEISKEVNSEDLVIEILGLDKNGIQEVTKNILLKQYRLNIEESDDKLKYHAIMKKLEDKALASIMKIPLLAVLCVKIWFKGEEIGKSLTSFYTAMVNMLVERAKGPHETERKLDHSRKKSSSCFIDKNLLLQLGKLAYDGLMTGLYIFELNAETILSDLGLTKSEYEFSLNVGLLSREEVDSIMPKKVKIYFFHASLQEYFSAVYIFENEEIRNSFFEHLSSVKDILGFGNVLVFLSGLDATLGSDVSKQIVNIAKEDKKLSEYRTTVQPDLTREVELMYKLQVSCYRELKYIQLCTDPSKPVVPFHVSDVYEGGTGSNIETIRTTVDILTYHHAEIRSLFMLYVLTNVENGVPDSILTQFLDHTVSLQSLSIFGGYRTLHHISDIFSSLTTLCLHFITLTTDALSTLQTKLQSNTVMQALSLICIYCQDNEDEGHCHDQDNENRRVLASLGGIIQVLPDLPCLTLLHIGVTNEDEKNVYLDVLSRLSHLHNISYHDGTSPRDDEYDHSIVQTLCTFSGLRELYLSNVNLSGCELQLHDMLHLKKINLFGVDMLPSGWKNFINSVLNISHQFDVHLSGGNIDEESLALIRSSSPQLQITQTNSSHSFDFTRVWPPPK